MDYPEVFAGGDCVTQQKPESALAQVAYQQAKAITPIVMFSSLWIGQQTVFPYSVRQQSKSLTQLKFLPN
jgi:NADH dehydrogenase FAD-containing subunit